MAGTESLGLFKRAPVCPCNILSVLCVCAWVVWDCLRAGDDCHFASAIFRLACAIIHQPPKQCMHSQARRSQQGNGMKYGKHATGQC